VAQAGEQTRDLFIFHLFPHHPSAEPPLRQMKYSTVSYHFTFGLDERPVGAVHLVVEAARVAQVVAVPVTPPQWGRGSCAVDTFAAL
jgi:hypothetical protein